jgi:glutamate-ammonia-ligase adenylyltransferase
MALTRARVIAGDATLAKTVDDVIARVLGAPRDGDTLRTSVREMRALIASEKGESNPWDLKLAAGGIVDIEFIAQYLILRHAGVHRELLTTDTALGISTAARLQVIAPEDADVLVKAHRIYSTVTQMMRLTIDEEFDPSKVACGVLRRIASAADCPDFPRLERELTETRHNVRAIFRKLLG